MTATLALICALLAATVSGAVESRGASIHSAVAQLAERRLDTNQSPEATGSNPVRGVPAAPLILAAVTASESIAKPGESFASPLAGGTTYTGYLAWAAASHGPRYLAVREPVGTLVQACGPAGCVTRRSTDFGPVLSLWRAGRIADLSAADWQAVCGVPLRFGLCPGSIEILSRRPATALPNTDTLEGE